MKPQRARVFWISLALMGMVSLTAVPAGAVSLNPYTYNVDGQLSIFGNNICPPSPCTETLTFSFRFEWAPFAPPFTYLGDVVPGSSSVTSSGPLSPFVLGEGQLSGQGFLQFGNTGDEIDLDTGFILTTDTPWIAPSFGAAYLWGCSTSLCITDFVPPDRNTGESAYFGLFIVGPNQVTVTAVPEEGTLGLLSFGLVGLALWQWKQRGRALA